MRKSLLTLALTLGFIANTTTIAADSSSFDQNEINGLIVKFKHNTSVSKQNINNRKNLLASIAGIDVNQMKRITDGIFTVGFDLQQIHNQSISQHQALADVWQNIIQKLNQNPNIEYVDLDIKMRMLESPTKAQPIVYDVNHDDQWNQLPPFGVETVEAWKATQGSPNITAAILDTGIACDSNNQPPSDLGMNTLPGISFVENNNTVCDSGVNTRFHGTHVAGIVAANGKILGIAPNIKVLPIKVLGDNGEGSLSNVLMGMLWAGGLDVEGQETNTHPSKILNLSLGGVGECGPAYTDVINQLTQKDVTIVVSAGNSNTDVNKAVPANCPGVISVAATNRAGQRSWYSNYGSQVTIAAPGGEQVLQERLSNPNWLTNGILSTVNCTDNGCGYEYMQGTSQAAPHVTGIVGLILSIYPEASKEEVKSILTESTMAFPLSSGKFSCQAPFECGAGIANAKQAVNQTLSIVAGVVPPGGEE